ncbi:ATP12 family chaperone protein [Roseospira navarrensis]|uniref:ATPase n=1 Tax=Roseospira navarrensis TaxID=140058 RepID=A0A7X2D4V0_9PROT|nr:ATP12 family protein [Roseospira navarrensis]MQX36997.1 ATPase [Roseospira navarrensis]
MTESKSIDPVAAARASQAAKRARRFYAAATAAPLGDGGHGVWLDGRPVRTPSQGPLRLPTPALADAVAVEWNDQGESIDPTTMPLTQLANTALERVASGRAAVVAELVRFVDADGLCYHADHPPELAARQAEAWQPLLDWASADLSAPLVATQGVMPLRQPPQVSAALEGALSDLDDWGLTAAQCIAGAAGSLVLALAVIHARLDGATCFALSRLDESFQMETWGEDAEAMAAREVVRRDILAAETLWRLSRA